MKDVTTIEEPDMTPSLTIFSYLQLSTTLNRYIMVKPIDRNKQIAAFIHSVTDSGIESEAQGIILSSGGSGFNRITKVSHLNGKNFGGCMNASSCNSTDNSGPCTNLEGACNGSRNGYSCRDLLPGTDYSISCMSVNVTPSSCRKL